MIKTIGQSIKELRKERNITQEELAEAINVTPQAISKWENSIGLPDISQVIPLATFFNVSTDVILGITEKGRKEEIDKIIIECNQRKKDIESWKLLQDALKKYPTNLDLLQESIEHAIAIAYKENETYNEEYAERIYLETIRQVDLIVKYSSNITNILRAHMIMVLLHSSFGNAEMAVRHANELPWRTDMNCHYMCAYINHNFKEYEIEKVNLQRSIEHHLISTIDNLVLLGVSYENTNNYQEALQMYISVLDMINYVFKEDDYTPPLYKVEDGNVYYFIARTYLKMENISECIKWLEKMVDKELELNKFENEEFIVKNKFLNKSKLTNFAKYRSDDDINKLDYILNLECFDPIRNNTNYKKLVDKIKHC